VGVAPKDGGSITEGWWEYHRRMQALPWGSQKCEQLKKGQNDSYSENQTQN